VLVAVDDALVLLLIPTGLASCLLRLFHFLHCETSRFRSRLLLLLLIRGDVVEVLAHLEHVEAVDAEHGAPVLGVVVAITATILALLHATAGQGDEIATHFREFRRAEFELSVEEFAHHGVLFVGDVVAVAIDLAQANVLLSAVLTLVQVERRVQSFPLIGVRLVRGSQLLQSENVELDIVLGLVFASAGELTAFLATRAVGERTVAERAAFVLDDINGRTVVQRIAHFALVFTLKLTVECRASGIPGVTLALTRGLLRVAKKLPGAGGAGSGKILDIKHISFLISKVFRSAGQLRAHGLRWFKFEKRAFVCRKILSGKT
jgi:hypothetical protein